MRQETALTALTPLTPLTAATAMVAAVAVPVLSAAALLALASPSERALGVIALALIAVPLASRFMMTLDGDTGMGGSSRVFVRYGAPLLSLTVGLWPIVLALDCWHGLLMLGSWWAGRAVSRRRTQAPGL